jgi:hypothetical protein
MRRVKDLLKVVHENFFLRKHTPLPSTIQLLRDLYPNVNWNRVDFYEGLPWFTPLVAPYVTAQALPDFYSFTRYRIYLRKFDESRAQCLADIVHEGYHIMQAMEFWKGYGIGFLRGLMIYYNALFFKFGYRSNPFEIPAYDQEFRFLDYCKRHSLHGIIPKVHPEALRNISKETSMVFYSHKFRYKENYFVLAGSFVVCLVIALMKPLLDVIMCIISGVWRYKYSNKPNVQDL